MPCCMRQNRDFRSSGLSELCCCRAGGSAAPAKQKAQPSATACQSGSPVISSMPGETQVNRIPASSSHILSMRFQQNPGNVVRPLYPVAGHGVAIQRYFPMEMEASWQSFTTTGYSSFCLILIYSVNDWLICLGRWCLDLFAARA